MSDPDTILTHTIEDGPTVTWTTADHDEAMKQGWYLDYNDGMLSLDPDGNGIYVTIFAQIRSRATEGDVHAIKAMIFNSRSTLLAWENKLQDFIDEEQKT